MSDQSGNRRRVAAEMQAMRDALNGPMILDFHPSAGRRDPVKDRFKRGWCGLWGHAYLPTDVACPAHRCIRCGKEWP